MGIFKTNHTYTEEEWNDESIEDVKEKGKESNGLVKYMASKTLAERGAIIFIQVPRCVRLHRVYASRLGVLQST